MHNKSGKDSYLYRKKQIEEICMNNNVYADKFERSHTLDEVSKLNEGEEVRICGRILFKRNFGKLIFMKIGDLKGSFQISFCINDFSPSEFMSVRNVIRVADFIGVKGDLYKTQKGEKTLRVKRYKILSMAIRALPEKYHGIRNKNLKYRKRYLDIITNNDSKYIFVKRCEVLKFIRNYFANLNFFEVESPILQNVASGAAAKPFKTRYNSLNKEFYLRIAPELYLKQIIGGGYDRIFEIGKCFRNEGMDAAHLQEFTMLEWYVAYWDYNDNVKCLKRMLTKLLDEVFGEKQFMYNGHTINIANPWIERNYCHEINKLIKGDILSYCDIYELKAVIKKYGHLSKKDLDESKSISALIDKLYKRKILPYIIQPTILYNYPAHLLPLARRNDDDNRIADAFQLVIGGMEIAKGYSELINPQIQEQEFIQQKYNREQGNDEALRSDDDFIVAMEHGMPPISGVGMGIDRLMALLCNCSSLREVILFPPMK